MRYSVTWNRDAENSLTQIWLEASDRQAVTAAAHRIDRVLSQFPRLVGDDFYGDWVYIVDSLGVAYSISDADRRVQIIHVWRGSK